MNRRHPSFGERSTGGDVSRNGAEAQKKANRRHPRIGGSWGGFSQSREGAKEDKGAKVGCPGWEGFPGWGEMVEGACTPTADC